MRQRDLRRRRGPVGRADPGHHLHRNAGSAGDFGFLAAAAEHERVPALEPHDVLARTGHADQQFADLFLRQGVMRTALGHADQLRIAARKCEDRRVDQSVMDDHPRALDQPRSAQRQEIGIARSRADEIDGSGLCHVCKMRGARPLRQSECVSG